ncbi:serine/threonine-protein kinase lmtk1 [Holotrichia oblita]|uniref:Serine/threonine-protein kinase lmtk1 n=1 Tax=Holotrichia oblita TaxID=644536 RepID=A0ACB9TTW4_HOLOL|nr:serine/threonine-protein kinase lmtk1 [Holotrichia oblita]
MIFYRSKIPRLDGLDNDQNHYIQLNLFVIHVQTINDEQKVQVIKQLVKWIEEHPNVSALKVPEICINLLNSMDNSNVVHNMTMSRMASLRSSLRRFSSVRNRVVPERLNVPAISNESRRSVTFSEELKIYNIHSS